MTLEESVPGGVPFCHGFCKEDGDEDQALLGVRESPYPQPGIGLPSFAYFDPDHSCFRFP